MWSHEQFSHENYILYYNFLTFRVRCEHLTNLISAFLVIHVSIEHTLMTIAQSHIPLLGVPYHLS